MRLIVTTQGILSAAILHEICSWNRATNFEYREETESIP